MTLYGVDLLSSSPDSLQGQWGKRAMALTDEGQNPALSKNVLLMLPLSLPLGSNLERKKVVGVPPPLALDP